MRGTIGLTRGGQRKLVLSGLKLLVLLCGELWPQNGEHLVMALRLRHTSFILVERHLCAKGSSSQSHTCGLERMNA